MQRWQLRPIGVLSALLLLVCQALAQSVDLPRIVPSGIDGAVLIAGRGDASAAALATFIEVAGGKKSRISVVCFDAAGTGPDDVPAEARNVLGIAERAAAEASLLRFNSSTFDAGDRRLSLLKNATGAWLIGQDLEKTASSCSTGALADALRDLRKRGGILGTSSVGELLGRSVPSVSRTKFGLEWLPDVVILTLTEPAADGFSQLPCAAAAVGCEILPGAALLVRGRNIEAVGSGNIFLHLAPAPKRPAEKISLEGRKPTDLTLLRRAARARATGFPPAEPGAPVVEKGTLVIVGGGKMPSGLLKQFVDLAGGARAAIVVLPTAAADPIPSQEGLADAFRRYGAKVTVLPGRTLAQVESPEYLEAFRNATGIWFGGGRQWNFVDAYEETKAHKLMFEVLQRGGVIGGTSAGASIQSDYMPRGSPYGNLEISAEGYERGLGFLKGVAIDQHFTQRRRHADMTMLMKTFPQYLGIGIDEATALIVRGHTAQVVGGGRAFFYDTRRTIAKGAPDYEAIAAGAEYDLKERRTVTTKQESRSK